MSKIRENLFDVGYLDTLARGRSFLHKLDPRAKLITTVFFIVIVVSYGKYTLSALIPFFIYPVALICMAGLPVGYLFKKIILISPFAFVVAIFNPMIDRDVLLYIGNTGIWGGWVSFLSILVRFVLTMSAALVLICLSGLDAVCLALAKLGVPRIFVVQLLLFFRYLFILADEAQRILRAIWLRSLGKRDMSLKVFVSVIGQLLLRTLDRANRIYLAMCSRGFDGNVRMIRQSKIGWREIVFICFWLALFLFLRWYNIPLKLGQIIALRLS